jgi:PadR family transcriptional regulator PadR
MFDLKTMYRSSRMPTRTIDNQLDLMKGSLDLLVLQTLATGRAHGHAIACLIEQRSDEVLQVGHGSLYPALQRLLKLGLIVAEDGISENNRKARFYRLTAKGRKHLFAEASKWQTFSDAMARILAPVVRESS